MTESVNSGVTLLPGEGEIVVGQTIEMVAVPELGVVEVSGGQAILEELRRRRNWISHVGIATRVLAQPDLRQKVVIFFQQVGEAEIDASIKRISTATANGQLPYLGHTRFDLPQGSDQRHRYNREVDRAVFGKAQLSILDAKALARESNVRFEEGRLLLQPAAVLVYPVTCFSDKYNLVLPGTMVHAHFDIMRWRDQSRMDRQSFIAIDVAGGSDFIRSEEAVEALGIQKATIDKTVAAFYRVTKRSLSRVYSGGLPGLGKGS